MAFHTACPITCRRICDCELGFAESRRDEFLDRISRVEEFLKDPWLIKDAIGDTVQVAVPRVLTTAAVEDCGGEEVEVAAAKRSALQRKAAAASRAVEEYARRVEAGIALDVSGEAAIDLTQEDQGSSLVKIICRICFSGENEGSKRAIKMLSCKFCNKKYHKSCLKIWAEYRDLFHWSSWTCPSCRICEVCRRAGDPNKLMYCKRCDDAYHCYCQQPPHKNVSHGPFLCPKHTRCHSCGSNVSGSGHSTRWFLAYTCCDACGRLFVKGKYCPVCLKVYRDSEMTPMVCCDVCQQWIHCECDGISDEKYQQFQSDGNLSYTCPACRGDCYQVKDTEDAVRELWRRRDKADRNLIVSLRSAAGLPSDGETFSISPYSDDDNENGAVIKKNDSQRSLKISVKGLADKTSKSSTQYVRNSPQSLSLNKKHSKNGYQVQSVGLTEEIHQTIEKQHEARLLGSSFEDMLLIDQKETRNIVKEAAGNNVNKVSKVHIRGCKTEGLHLKEGAKNIRKDETPRGTKLVIHLAAKNRTSPISEASSCHRDQDFVAVNEAKLDNTTWTPGSNYEEGENNFVKFKNVSDTHGKRRANVAIESDITTPHANQPIISKKSSSKEKVLPSEQSVGASINIQSQIQDASEPFPFNSSSDLKPLLKLKFRSPYFEQRSSWAPKGVEEKNAVKGQRSKRKRASMEKLARNQEDESSAQVNEEKPIDEVMDANWILKKLGMDAIGKKVEVHQSSDNSWQKGVVSDVIEENTSLLVCLDDGRSKTVELGKQGIRFVAHKQKRTKVSAGKS